MREAVSQRSTTFCGLSQTAYPRMQTWDLIRSIRAWMARGRVRRLKAEADIVAEAFRQRVERGDTRGQHILERPAALKRAAQLAAELGRPLPKPLALSLSETAFTPKGSR